MDAKVIEGTATKIATVESQPPQPSGASPLDLPAEVFQAGLDRRGENRAALMAWVRGALVEGTDYGSIKTKRGPSKPSLWKPGAEKICGMLGVTVHFPTLHDYEQAALNGVELKQIIVRCEIQDVGGRVVADGIGARSLKQDYGDINKALKMAEKSAHIDATLRMAGLSEVFTQDLEDMATNFPKPESAVPTNQAAANPSREAPPVRQNGATISEAQHKRLEARINELKLERERVKTWMKNAWNLEHFTQLSKDQYQRLYNKLEAWAERLAIQTGGAGA